MSCASGLIHAIVNVTAMLIYMVSLAIALWNVKRLDKVNQRRSEIKEVEKIQMEVDEFEGTASPEDGGSISNNCCIETVQNRLSDLCGLLDAFVDDKCLHDRTQSPQVQIEKHKRLIRDLDRPLPFPRLILRGRKKEPLRQ